MTTYNTGSPVGSSDPRDLYDNAENFDTLVNSPDKLEHPDRLGVARKTWHGIEEDFQRFLLESGYQDIGTYAAGLEITARNQIFVRNGEYYRAAASLSIPYTTTGDWATEGGSFVSLGDAILRQDLATNGSELVTVVTSTGTQTLKAALDDRVTTYSTISAAESAISSGLLKNGQTVLVNGSEQLVVSGQLVEKSSLHPISFGAAGDGEALDNSAFNDFEVVVKGRDIDLLGKSYLTTEVKTGNNYYNGNFIIDGFVYPTNSPETYPLAAPRCSYFGGQLAQLKDDLSNPLCQLLGIVFIGDSITWGSGATGATGEPGRDGTLSDPRAPYGAPSFVNQFKRYIRDNYKRGDGLAEAITNWPASSSGESTVLYQNTEIMYPRYEQFTVQKIGASQDPSDLFTTNSPTNAILSLNNTVDSAQYGHSIEFQFTGSRFILSIRTSTDGTLDAFFDVLINGALVQTIDARPGANGLVNDNALFDQQLEINFDFVRDATITIRTNRNGLTGQRLLSVTALRVPRQVRITNNGIVGATSVSYTANNLDGNTSGDGVAITFVDEYVICQIGTNDRAATSGRPSGANQFARNLGIMLDNASLTGKKLILMAANPAKNEDSSIYPFHMQEVRNIVFRTARARSLDFIDNYTIFQRLNNDAYTADGLHPGDLGHTMIARNIIGALESSV